MKRNNQPELPEPKFKKKARIRRTSPTRVETTIQIEPDDPTQKTLEGDVDKFIQQAMRRFRLAADAENYNRLEGLQDVLMVDGEGQWDDDIRVSRLRQKRPCLTMNRFIPMIAHVANEQRMSKIGTTIEPVGGGADVEDALIRQGLIRHIEVESHSETVDDECFERMVEKGWSWQRIVTDWESETSHNQVIRIEAIDNDFSVYSDPTAIEQTRRDAKWHFIVFDMPRGEYMEQFPNSQAAGLVNWSTVGDSAPGWITPDSIRIAEYYYMDEIPAKSVRLMGGDGVWRDEIEERDGLWYKSAELEAMERGSLKPEQVQPVSVEKGDDGQLILRDSYKLKPKWCKINAVEILDGDKSKNAKANTKGRDVAGKYLPMIMVCGRQRTVKGVRRLSGMVRNNRDAQRMYNYAVSGFVEMIALAPKSPFIAAAGQIEKYKPIWDNMNTMNYPWLPYDPVTINGQPAPPPQRQNMEAPVMGLVQAIREFDNDLKIGFNIYDPSLGTAKADQSGRAIAGLQARSDTANFNWLDNMNRARVQRGEVILEMIPTIYHADRVITIVRPDDKRQEVRINQTFKDKDGNEKVDHDMAVGKFSVTVSTGQYASKRQAAVQTLSDVAKNVPQVALPLLPLILENMDGPMAKEAAAIVKRMQPPQLQEPGSPEQMMAQFQSMMQQHQLLVTALQRANDTLRTKQLDLASREYIAGLQAQAQIVAASMKTGSAESIAMATAEYKRITDLLNMNHERLLAEQQNAHEVNLASMEQAQPQGASQ